MNNRLYTVTALAVALGCGVARAQKFAIIDMQQAVLATSDGKKASQAINEKFSPVKAEIDKMAADITAKQKDFTKNRATMTPAQLADAQTALETLTTALKRKQDDAQQDLEDEESKQLGTIVPKLTQIINEFAAANQITIVLDTSAAQNNMIYGDGSLNIITPVVTAYEKAAGNPAPAAPAKPPAASTPKPPMTVPRTPPGTTTTAPKTTPPAK